MVAPFTIRSIIHITLCTWLTTGLTIKVSFIRDEQHWKSFKASESGTCENILYSCISPPPRGRLAKLCLVGGRGDLWEESGRKASMNPFPG